MDLLKDLSPEGVLGFFCLFVSLSLLHELKALGHLWQDLPDSLSSSWCNLWS